MNYEKLNNNQKELVKYWMMKYYNRPDMNLLGFIEKHLTPEPVIKVGKVYKGNQQKNSKAMYYCTSFDANGDPIGYGFDVDGKWVNTDLRPWTTKVVEISEDEWSQRLMEEAKRQGFIDGALTCGVIGSESQRTNGEFFTNNPLTSLCVYFSGNSILGKEIYSNGKWAEIIDNKAEVKAEIQELQDRLEKLKEKL